MDEEDTKLGDMARIQNAVRGLMEHFDSVQVIVTRCDSELDATVFAHYGAGDIYARRGAVREWLVRTDEVTRIGVRMEQEP